MITRRLLVASLALAACLTAGTVAASEKAADPKEAQLDQVRVSYSAELCVYQTAKHTAEENIAREKALGKKYGVLNTAQILAETSRIGAMNSLIPQAKSALKKLSGPLPCGKNEQVAELVSCFWNEYLGGYCDQEAMERCEFASVAKPVTTCVW